MAKVLTEDERAAIASIEEVAETFRLVLKKRLRGGETATSMALNRLVDVVNHARESIYYHGTCGDLDVRRAPHIPGACI